MIAAKFQLMLEQNYIERLDSLDFGVNIAPLAAPGYVSLSSSSFLTLFLYKGRAIVSAIKS